MAHVEDDDDGGGDGGGGGSSSSLNWMQSEKKNGANSRKMGNANWIHCKHFKILSDHSIWSGKTDYEMNEIDA